LNKKFKKSLFKSSIDKKIGDGEMTVVDRIFFGSWKTKDAFNFVKSFDEDFSNFLLVLSCNEENKEKIIKSFRNLPFVRILEGNVVNSAQIISSKRIVVTRLAFKEILRDRLI
jgi:ribosomal protein L4